MIALLLQYGADVNHKNSNGSTAAHELRSLLAAYLLIESGANLLEESSDGESVLFSAVKHNIAEVIPLILQAGANINEHGNNGYSLLHQAAFYHAYEVIPVLLQVGMDINEKNFDGKTPLCIAVERGFDDNPLSLLSIKLLLDAGADMNIIDNAGHIALNYTLSQNVQNLFFQAQADRDYREYASSAEENN